MKQSIKTILTLSVGFILSSLTIYYMQDPKVEVVEKSAVEVITVRTDTVIRIDTIYLTKYIEISNYKRKQAPTDFDKVQEYIETLNSETL